MLFTKRIKSATLLITLVVISVGVLFMNGTFASSVISWLVNNSGTETKLTDNESFNVDLQYCTSDNVYSSILGENTTQPFSSSSFWCPGRSELAYLKIVNKERFPVNVTLTLNVEDNGFGNVLSYAFIPGVSKSDATDWNDFVAKSNKAPIILTKGSHKLLEKVPLAPEDNDGSSTDLAICIHMDENASSDYEQKSVGFKFKLQVDADYKPGETPSAPVSVPNS